MHRTLAIVAVAGLVSAAHAQSFTMVINTPPNSGPSYTPGTLIEYSLWLLDGDQFVIDPFFGWSHFEGTVSAPGTHIAPVETVSDVNGGTWEGRRPPSTVGFPGGSAGGFRFDAQSYAPVLNGLAGTGGDPIVGHAASVPEGGFLQDDSPNLEVFRGSFVADVPGSHDLVFQMITAGYFSNGINPIVLIDPLPAQVIGAPYTVVPGAATLAPLAIGGLCVRRRR